MKDTPVDRIPPKVRTLIVVLLLSVLVLSVYGTVGRHEFVGIDDPLYVTDNPVVRHGITWEGTAWAFTNFSAANWHPLTWLSHMADVETFGLDAGRHHQVNVLLHLLNTVLLFFVLRGMTEALWPSFFTAALFGVHPLHVESVAWIAERKDVLSAFFWILGMGAYARYVRRPGTRRYLGVAACLALGLMSKPMLVTFPFALLLLDWWPHGRFGERPLSLKAAWPLVREKIPLFAMSAASSVVTYLAQSSVGAAGAMDKIPAGVRLSNAVVSYGRYLLMTLWPRKLAVFYPHPAMLGEGIPWWSAAVSALLLAAITYLALRRGRRWPYLPVGWLWYLGTLVPVIGLVQVGSQAMADRYTYVPLIGIFLVASFGIPAALSGLQWRFRTLALGVLGAAALIGLSVSARAQAGYWRDNLSLFSRAVAVTEKNWLALSNLGSAYCVLGHYQRALEYDLEALRFRPADPTGWNNLGTVYSKLDRHDEARQCYAKALSLRRYYPMAWYNLGVSYGKSGRYADAVSAYREALRQEPELARAWSNLGTDYERLGRMDEAVRCLAEAVRIDPADPDAWVNLGNVFSRLERFPEAADAYRQAVRLSPGNAETWNNMGYVLGRIGMPGEAISSLREALRLNPNTPDGWNNLGNAFNRLGRYNEAIDAYREALRISPDDPLPWTNLGYAYARSGQMEKAAEVHRRLLKIDPVRARRFARHAGLSGPGIANSAP